ncbi:uncharacterized protein LOC143215831 [Lasioglossum baleicum]|uniref:uncharacterized protein LOC143215831 n=1 Tax=Lasioglossum baleicum TaxID=434251 RepID=UPI003FCE161A
MACHQTGLPSHHHPADHQHQQQQHQHHQHHHHPQQQHQQLQLGHAAAAAAAAASMGMESSELVAVAHYQAQQLQRQLLAEQSGQAGTMLPPAATQPTGGGMTQPLQQGQHAAAGAPQSQGQDPLQSLMQQLICLQQIEYFLAQRGHK